MHFQVKKKNQTGAALLIVIMITAIMSIIMTLMLHQSRLDMKLTALVKNRTIAELSLETLQSTFVFDLMTTPLHLVGPKYTNDEFIFDSLVSDFKGSVAVVDKMSISVQDLGGMVSLKPYDEKNFNRLLIQQGYSNDMLLAFNDKLEDWQDVDSLVRLEGKEKGDYADYPFFPSNMSLQSVNELAYILEPTVFKNIKPWIVLYGQGDINRQFTPEALYSAAGIEVTKNKEGTSNYSGGEGAYVYPSGRYFIKLSFKDRGVSLNKQFLLIRGLDTFQPFFVANEKLF
ncbi:general secretion pathway protein GspK [Pseudocolwellia agarivorans]|uniref:general secretion pathway protein GspK n=1 Tax=Pseudocolwellia agarivorans TaxID=1911682 RepID=UPI00158BAE32|nr:type II secretion system protein GspK [Pseudocolwellia agarivorans]